MKCSVEFGLNGTERNNNEELKYECSAVSSVLIVRLPFVSIVVNFKLLGQTWQQFPSDAFIDINEHKFEALGEIGKIIVSDLSSQKTRAILYLFLLLKYTI